MPRDKIRLKRVYDQVESADGKRYLVDRIWPRGISKADANVDSWLRELAPSDELRKWYGHDTGRWGEFKRRYRLELKSSAKKALLKKLALEQQKETITLIADKPTQMHGHL